MTHDSLRFDWPFVRRQLLANASADSRDSSKRGKLLESWKTASRSLRPHLKSIFLSSQSRLGRMAEVAEVAADVQLNGDVAEPNGPQAMESMERSERERLTKFLEGLGEKRKRSLLVQM